MKLMVLDGNSLVNRAFYGIRMLNSPDGTPTNAVYGFLNILHKLQKEENPDALCVTFDMKAPTFRKQQYEEYKAQRKGMPEELAVQMPLVKEVLDALRIRRYELEGYEADDLIGTIAARCETDGWDCLVVTGDKDSFQLITPKTHVKHVKTRAGQTEEKVYDQAAFREEYGFDPLQIIDLKALMGDSSDNIPGVPGIGEKTAMDLLHRFGTLEGIYENLDSPDIKPAAKKKLEAGREMARLSYDLATIRRDVPLDFSPQENLAAEPDREALYQLFQALGFSKMMERYSLTPPDNRQTPTGTRPPWRHVPLITEAAFAQALGEAETVGTAAVAWEDLQRTFAFCLGDTAYSLAAETFPGDYPEACRQFFSAPVQKTGHNCKDRQRELLAMGCSPEGWEFDTALAAYLIDPTGSHYPLEEMVSQWCGYPLGAPPQEDQQLTLDMETGEAERIASAAAAVAALRPPLETRLEEMQMNRLLQEVEMPLCTVLARMENAGFLVDQVAIAQFGQVLGAQIQTLQEEIYRLAGGEFNINSPKQLGTVLFERLMLPSSKKTKTGWSTNIEVLTYLQDKHPIVPKIMEYRQLSKLKSTYTDALLTYVAADGRIHTTFQMTVTATGRLSSTDPNLQNIPVRRALGGELRKMFVAAPGNVLVDADYSQIELRLLAHISGDETMREAFLTGEDIHRVTASQVFGVPPEDVTPFQRSSAKAVNFGIVYGISPFSLSQDIGVTVAEARRYMDNYLAKYHGVREYMGRIVEQAKADGYVATLFGRRRPLPELKSSNRNTRAFGERVALNMPIQGTAADIMKIAMIRVDAAFRAAGLRARLLLQVHDELIAECPQEETDAVREILCREMEAAANLSVPLTADAGVGRSWYEAK